MEDKSDDSSVDVTVSEEEQESIRTTNSIQVATTSNPQRLRKRCF